MLNRCRYPDIVNEELLRDRVVAGVYNERLRERLLMEPDTLTIENAITLAQNFERATTECGKFHSSGSNSQSLQALGQKQSFRSNSPFRNNRSNSRSFRSNRGRNPNSGPNRSMSPQFATQSKCKFCGNGRHPQGIKCPAFGKTCNKCGRQGHFAVCC